MRRSLLILSALVALIAVACTPDDPSASPVPTTEPALVDDTQVAAPTTAQAATTTEATSPPVGTGTALDQLVVAPEHLDGGYDRDLYSHWESAPNGCSVRVEVLVRDSTTPAQVDMSGRCAVFPGGGDWYSPYDDTWTDDPSTIEIDHFVPLAEAHRSGAWAWDPQRRAAFANDLTNPFSLIAVSGASNQAKSDSDPADWLPANTSFHCEYAHRWVAVKSAWGLTVDTFERDALAGILAGCAANPLGAWQRPQLPAAPTGAPLSPTVPSVSDEAAAPCAPGQVKGNRNSGIYHVPSGQHYAATYANVACFDSEADAQAAGFRRSQR